MSFEDINEALSEIVSEGHQEEIKEFVKMVCKILDYAMDEVAKLWQ